jgi:hypothetical protein
LQSPTLQDINDVHITVLQDGFVPHDPQKHSNSNSFNNQQQAMTPGMMVGIIFATIFCIGLIAIWVYLCTMVNGVFILNNRNLQAKGDVFKNESVTDHTEDGDEDAHTNRSLYSTTDEENSLDMWARNLTSIKLRQPELLPMKKKRGAPTRQSFLRPARTHTSSLDYIQEADNESCASTVASARTSASATTKQNDKKTNQRSQIATIDENNT